MSLVKNRYRTQAEWHSDLFSTTFSATHQEDGRSLLITQIHEKWLTSVLVETLLQTCQQLSAFRHPAVASVLDFHFDGRSFFIVYDVPSTAKPMETVIRAERGWPAEKHIKLVDRILEGLISLETHGLYHGHLNFMTVWMVVDQPVLAHSQIYSILFSANIHKFQKYNNGIFLAPEQITTQTGSPSSDMFSAAAMLYILLSHRWPVTYTDILASLPIAYQTGIEPFQPVSDVSPLITTFLHTCLTPLAQNRFATIAECQQALGLARYEPQPVPPAVTAFTPPIDVIDNSPEEESEKIIPVSKRYLIGIPLLTILGITLLYTIYSLYMTAVPIQVVPDVEGLSVSEATEKLEALGLRASVSGSRFSIDVPVGHILESRPAAGREVKQNRLIMLFIAKRAEQLQVPEFQGRSWTQSLALASEVGIRLTTLEEQYSATVDIGYVINQDTTPNITVSPNVMVGLILSKGYPIEFTISPSSTSDDLRSVEIALSVPDHWPTQTIVIQHQTDGKARTLFSKVCSPKFETTIHQELDVHSSIQIIYNNKVAGSYMVIDPVENIPQNPSENEETNPLPSR